MPAAVTKAGPYYSSGSISFASLRSNFRAQQPDGSFASDTLPLRASELRRITTASNTTPTVPDATENANISTLNNLRISQFRNSIKYYFITQTGTDATSSGVPGFNIGTQSWNSNLNKNIRKYMYLNGTTGSTTTSQYATFLQAETHNLQITVSGGVYGAGGSAGTSGNVSGGNGGPAMYVQSTGSQVIVNVNGGCNIYGGGGGGEKGSTGSSGSDGTCFSISEYTTGGNCGGCPGCGGDEQINCRGVGGCNCGKGGCGNTVYVSDCRRYTPYSVPGAPGGEGGNGGVGQGYGQSRTNGSGGAAGTPGGCPSFGGSGQTGETGGNGGDWGSNGGNTSNSGSGGAAGRAITGSNYSVTGSINSATIRGAYQP